jgi:hypothetical protein
LKGGIWNVLVDFLGFGENYELILSCFKINLYKESGISLCFGIGADLLVLGL